VSEMLRDMMLRAGSTAPSTLTTKLMKMTKQYLGGGQSAREREGGGGNREEGVVQSGGEQEHERQLREQALHARRLVTLHGSETKLHDMSCHVMTPPAGT
jgi:hypothetical protein